MVDYILGLATGLLSWPVIVGIVLLGILSEHNDSRGWAVFWAIVAVAISYFYFTLSLEDLAMYAGAYVVIGFLWSFWRYRRFVTAQVEKITARYSKHEDRRQAAADLAPHRMIDTIIAWVIVWPFSVVENLTADLINGIEHLVKTVFKGIYTRIYNAAIKDLL